MKIAISAESNAGLESTVGHHFGRCPYYVIVDVEDGKISEVVTIENPYYAGHEPGMVPGFINEQKVNVMISGGMGGRAIQFFDNFGIEVATGASGQVGATIERYLSGDLTGTVPCNESVEHGH